MWLAGFCLWQNGTHFSNQARSFCISYCLCYCTAKKRRRRQQNGCVWTRERTLKCCEGRGLHREYTGSIHVYAYVSNNVQHCIICVGTMLPCVWGTLSILDHNSTRMPQPVYQLDLNLLCKYSHLEYKCTYKVWKVKSYPLQTQYEYRTFYVHI